MTSIAEAFQQHTNSAGRVVMTPAQIEQEVLSHKLVEKGAEVALLDWLSDAEIGEPLFNVLYLVDRVRKQLRGLQSADQAFADIQEARRMLAAHLQWIDEVCTREGRPPLADYERGALAPDGDTAA